ncbi:MAG: aminofutalosine synthase MqnE [Fidelibacterota bacterium]
MTQALTSEQETIFKGYESLAEKVLTGQRLSFEEGVSLFRNISLPAVGYLANIRRETISNQKAYYIRNQVINYSNICINRCSFCAFHRKRDTNGAYTLTLADIEKKVRDHLHEPISEIHVVGGLHPDLPFSYYVDMVRLLKSLRPQAVLKMYDAVEIDYFSRISGKSVERVLKDLMEAGLQAMPGGGAELFAPRVRKILCPEKISAERWLEITKIAHRMGLKSNATMLYGHVETPEERVDHMIRIRKLQDETGGILNFIPLPYQPLNNALKGKRTYAGDDLKVQAVSRLMLDNIPHVKAFWIYLTPPVAQIALNFGADDIDGTVIEEHVAHEAGAETRSAMTVNELKTLIRSAGYIPVERDTFFREIREDR